jgi:hypothetical protein
MAYGTVDESNLVAPPLPRGSPIDPLSLLPKERVFQALPRAVEPDILEAEAARLRGFAGIRDAAVAPPVIPPREVPAVASPVIPPREMSAVVPPVIPPREVPAVAPPVFKRREEPAIPIPDRPEQRIAPPVPRSALRPPEPPPVVELPAGPTPGQRGLLPPGQAAARDLRARVVPLPGGGQGLAVETPEEFANFAKLRQQALENARIPIPAGGPDLDPAVGPRRADRPFVGPPTPGQQGLPAPGQAEADPWAVFDRFPGARVGGPDVPAAPDVPQEAIDRRLGQNVYDYLRQHLGPLGGLGQQLDRGNLRAIPAPGQGPNAFEHVWLNPPDRGQGPGPGGAAAPFRQVEVPGGQQPIRVGPGFVPTGPIPGQPATRNPILTAISEAPSPSYIINMLRQENVVNRPAAGGPGGGGGGGGAALSPAPPLPPLPVPKIPDVKMAPLPAQAPPPQILGSEIPLLSALLFRKQALM